MQNIKALAEKDIERKIIDLRGQKVILDNDVAKLYGVETKRINEAVRNNPEKFPEGYVFSLNNNEKDKVVENFDHLKYSSVLAKAFTEKGLYMLATILKSPAATQTTIAIVETFAKIRELSRSLTALTQTSEKPKQKSLIQKSGEIISDILDNNLRISNTETSVEINLAVLKIKHSTKEAAQLLKDFFRKISISLLSV